MMPIRPKANKTRMIGRRYVEECVCILIYAPPKKKKVHGPRGMRGVRGVIALGSTGTDSSRSFLCWPVRGNLRSFLRKGSPVGHADADVAKENKGQLGRRKMAGMIALGSTGTDLSRSFLRWSMRHVLRSYVRKKAPVGNFLHILLFTR